MVQKPESDAEPKERRIDLSLPQVAGSAVAAVAAAVAASQLGVYGTIAGAGVMSVVATCGGSVFQHFFRRTGEQIREVTVQVTHPEGRQVTVHTKETTPAGRRGAERRTEREAASAPTDDATTVLPTVDPGAVPEVLAEGESTQLLKPVADTDRTQLLDLGDARTRMLRAQPGPAAGAGSDPDRTQLLPQAGEGPAATAATATGDAFTEGTTHGTRLRGWKRPALAAAAVFAVSMAGITAFEMISGNDLSGGKGTTLSSVVRGGGDRDPGPADPTPSGGTGQDGEGGDQQTPGNGDGDKDGTGTGSAPATDPGDGGSQSPDPGTGTGDGNPGTGSTPTPTPSTSGDGQTTPAPTPTPSAPDGGATGAPDPTTAPGTGGAAGQGEQAPPADGTGGE
ncbi:hypothetical protein PV390_00545 [Streptomyces sp. ME02-6991-2A]|uniref:hypothetical protein n=1 Tax=Streptomyces sp. ME02-6991-2A TaxID=3028677 RepID=UPI0029BC9C16|nr:hypothetical protein [Streptomyces sp. ME02-6991-2A]MDX3372879.1 hypothetical protein [Streptomyces sp. ME02-6991-2A]